jgi:hypothetical protein
MRGQTIMCFCLLSFALVCNPAMMAQDLRVLVLGASDAKPQANVNVEYFCTRPQHNSAHKTVRTDNKGVATISNPCSSEEEVEIALYPTDKKEQCGVGSITLKEILSVGAVAKPDEAGGIWCPTKVSRAMKPVPGQIIMFVKKPTWWQSHFAG